MTETHTFCAAPRILVVVDEVRNRNVLMDALERNGFILDMANDGQEALTKIAVTAFDLVLLDITMSDLDGMSVLKTVRTAKNQAVLPIIMISDHGESQSVVDAIERGANDYIIRPIDGPVLRARIRAQLEIHRTHADLKESKRRHTLAFRGDDEGLWDWDLRSGKIYFSERWLAMLGLKANDLGHDPEAWFKRVHPDELTDLHKNIETHLQGQNDAFEYEYRALHKDGKFRWLQIRGVATRNDDGQAVRISGSQTNMSSSKAYDPITASPNQTLFMDRLKWLLDKGKRKRDGNFAVILVKIDRLRGLRQTLGAIAVEEILMKTAQRLSDCLRNEDTLTNLRADETFTVGGHGEADFAVLVESCRDETTAPKMAERMQHTVQKPLHADNDDIMLTASLGIVMGGDHHEGTAQDLLQHAANALKRAVLKGPGHFELFDREMQTRALARLKMETDLRHAIAAGQLSLHFQPIVEIASGNVSGCEALARWTHPELGNVPPSVFIPLAEECGLIDAIGEWVLEQACLQRRKWAQEGLPQVDLSVNLSVLQMQRDGIEDRILDILARTDMPPDQLKLEITESIFMEDMERIGRILATLNENGIGIAIDDFGTGYSSLAYLSRLPITHLKIDRSFIADVSTDIASQAIVQSTLLMAQSLGIKVVAEGIEAKDQLALLEVLKAEYGQGFHFWRPMEGDDFTELLRNVSQDTA